MCNVELVRQRAESGKLDFSCLAKRYIDNRVPPYLNEGKRSLPGAYVVMLRNNQKFDKRHHHLENSRMSAIN